MMIQIIAAVIATVGFSVLFGVPSKYYPYCGVIGGAGWLFLIAGIFPLVPGAGVYWTAYYIVTDQLRLAAETGYTAVKVAVAIVLGIVFIFELPQGLFVRLAGNK